MLTLAIGLLSRSSFWQRKRLIRPTLNVGAEPNATPGEPSKRLWEVLPLHVALNGPRRDTEHRRDLGQAGEVFRRLTSSL